jgi:hypothetical protein
MNVWFDGRCIPTLFKDEGLNGFVFSELNNDSILLLAALKPCFSRILSWDWKADEMISSENEFSAFPTAPGEIG